MSSPRLVHHFLERAAQGGPARDFLVHEKERASYGSVEAGANRVARVLIAEGMARGDRVALLAANSRFYVEAYYGTLKAGCIAVPLNTAADGPGLAACLGRCGARALLVGRRFAKPTRAAFLAGAGPDLVLGEEFSQVEGLPGARSFDLAERASGESAEPPGLALHDDDVASIVFTSGSTATPRGATLSHRNLVANTGSIVSYLELRPDDSILALLPFYYVYGKSLLNTHAAAGGRVVIENRFMFPNTALDTLEREACSGLAGVPSTFAILLNRSTLADRALPHLRYVTQAGGAMSPALTRRLMEALPGQAVFVMYGATEASARLSYLPPADLPRKLGSIGVAIPGVELRVLRADGSECDVGEEGEIVARGPNIMSGYWEDPEATRSVLDEDGYHTGDLARRDEDGFLFVVGRRKDFIKAGAHRISAQEIEEAILEQPEVHEAAVVGVADEILGEKIAAFVVLRDPAVCAPQALIKALKRRLPSYKVPSVLEILDDLPKNESGKIMKRSLVQQFARDSGAST